MAKRPRSKAPETNPWPVQPDEPAPVISAPASALVDLSDGLLRQIMNSMSDGIYVLDRSWRFLYLNEPAKQMLPGGAGLLGRNVWEAFPEAVNRAPWTYLRRTMDEGVPTQFLHFHIPYCRWHEVRGFPTEQGILVNFRDITLIREEEQQLRLLQQAVASAPMGITVAEFKTSSDCPLIYVNPAFERLTGYTSSEVLGRDCRFLQGSDLQQSGREEMREAIAGGKPAKIDLRNYKKNGRQFINEVHISQVVDETGRVTHLVGIQNDVTDQLENKAKLARQAQYDALTGLANRYLMVDRLREALSLAQQRQTQMAVVVIDLDNFKYMNDRLGHVEADRVLVEVGRRLRSVVDEPDTVARMGGDEFTLVLSTVIDTSSLQKRVEKVLKEISKPIRVAGQSLMTTASAGVALYPRDSREVEELIQFADVSMYTAKRSGKNSFRFYHPGLRLNSEQPLDLAVDFRRALAEKQFELFYQPRVSSATYQVTGFEALIRWHHPARGLLLPAHFIRVAEDTGIIKEIGLWALEEALQQNAAWQQAGMKPVSMSVNVSPVQFKDPSFPSRVETLVRRSGQAPSSLELEVTESLLIDHTGLADDSLHALNQFGVRIAIDDFGIGYSGFHYLSRFPVSTLKIDRSFTGDIVTDKTDAAICRSILELGEALNLTTVAEGVETEHQANLLQSWRCTELQGHLFAEPLQEEAATRFLRDRR